MSPYAAHAGTLHGSAPARRRVTLWGWLRPREEKPRRQPQEQRVLSRYEVRTPATIVEVDGQGNPGRSWSVEVLNISRGGAAVATSIFVAPGSPLMLQFPATKSGPARHIMARVVHIRRLNELDYLAGVQFETFTQRARGRAGGSDF